MLKKESRLPKTKFRAQKTLNLQSLILKIAANNVGISRFGFVVSKKIDKRAVVRNKVKRILRNCLQECLVEIRPGIDFLFIVKRLPEKTICLEIKEVLKKESYLK